MTTETPSEEIFNQMKCAAFEVWGTYDNTHGYVTEKFRRINAIENFQENCMAMYQMFDPFNQQRMRKLLSPETLNYIDLWLK